MAGEITRDRWTSRFGFIMATAGFSIGLGNIWRFPYLTGTHGGGAFLLVYLIFALVIGIPLLSAEISLGRQSGLTPIAGMQRLSGSKSSPWNLIGWLGVAAAVLIQSYYVMVIGWILGYTVMILTGSLNGADTASLSSTYQQFTATPGPVFGYTAAVVVLLALIVSRGLHQGLERVAKVAMPVLLLLLVGLAVRSLSFPGALRGLVWYLQPDLSKLNGATLLAALGQAFYSIGIGMAVAFGFGSYLDRDHSDVPGSAAIVVLCDTAVALLAGLVIFPALFAFDLQPNAGPGLIFETLPRLFAEMPVGQLFGVSFFCLLLLAAITSAAALHQVLSTTLTDLLPIRRRTSTWLLASIFLALATLIILSLGPWTGLRLFGMDLFVFADTLSGNFLLPAGALLLALFTALVWGFERFRTDTNRGAGRFRITATWKPLMVVLIPLAVALVVAVGGGIL